MTTNLRALLEQQWSEHLSLHPECPLVFHRNGKRVKDIRGSWNRACRDAGVMDKIPHDLWRTGVWNMVRAGISERVAMTMAGHKTRSVFDCYHIVSDGDLKEAAQKLNRVVSTPKGHNFRHNTHADYRENPLSA